MLRELHAVPRGERLLRRHGRRLVVTARGRQLADDPPGLFGNLAAKPAAVARIPAGEGDDPYDHAEAIRPAIVTDDWTAGGESPEVRDSDLEAARADLEHLATLPERGGMYLPARGLRFAFDTGDPEGLAAQLCDGEGPGGCPRSSRRSDGVTREP